MMTITQSKESRFVPCMSLYLSFSSTVNFSQKFKSLNLEVFVTCCCNNLQLLRGIPSLPKIWISMKSASMFKSWLKFALIIYKEYGCNKTWSSLPFSHVILFASVVHFQGCIGQKTEPSWLNTSESIYENMWYSNVEAWENGESHISQMAPFVCVGLFYSILRILTFPVDDSILR